MIFIVLFLAINTAIRGRFLLVEIVLVKAESIIELLSSLSIFFFIFIISFLHAS